ncbi:MAG TPA: hypothetical protein VKE98_14520 [Gemmataceae bacterium]|nr:hypothetical protein [Gemmataceae bacterium]
MLLSNSDYHLLAYLHDARCNEVLWDCNDPNSRSLHIVAIVDPEAGYPLWDGKTLEITLVNVVGACFEALGFVLGEENLDSWRLGVSESFERECEYLKLRGITTPPVRFTITFRSGSILEVVCSGVIVEEKR